MKKLLAFFLPTLLASQIIMIVKKPASGSTLSVATGAYTGNGSDNRDITLAFTPKVVLAWCSTGSGRPTIRIDTMSGDDSNHFAGAGTDGANLIQSISSNAFQLGSSVSVNQNSANCSYLAIGGASAVTFSYTGDGADNRDLTVSGITPNFVIICPASSQNRGCSWRGASPSGDAAFQYNTSATANLIQALSANTVQVGSSVQVNENGSTYYGVAVAFSTGYSNSSYTGNATDNRDITGLSITPSFVLVKGNVGVEGVMRTTDMSGDVVVQVDGSSYFSDAIQSVGAGQFQVGTSSLVNANGFTYYYWGIAAQ